MNLAREAAEVRAVARIGAVLPSETGADVKQEKSDRFANVPLGQRLAAEVLSQFGGDKYLVDVAGNRVRMSLPGSLRAGDQLQISLLAKTPRLTFLLLSAHPPDTAFLSPAGRLLGKILLASDAFDAHLGLVSAEPVIETPAADPTRISTALHDRLTTSGLFHEAHIAEWANGTRSIQSLSREPQQQLSQLAPPDGKLAADSDAISLDLARLINLQLDALEYGRLSWRGEAWPEQSMQWKICKETTQRDSGRDADEGEERHPIWRTTVHFELPALGSVSASLRVDGERLQIRIETAEPLAAATLKTRSTELLRNLDAAGLRADSLQFGCHGDAA